MISVSNRPKTLLFALSILTVGFFAGCAEGRREMSLENQFEPTRLPVHFNSDPARDVNQFSLAVGAREASAIDVMAGDSGRVSVREAAYGFDGALVFEKGYQHFGVNLGLSPSSNGLFRLAGFYGIGGPIGPHGPLVFSFSTGLGFNVNYNDGQFSDSYWDYDGTGFFPVYRTVRDSSRGGVRHFEIPARAGILFDTKTAVSPYLTGSANLIGIGISGSEKKVMTVEAGTGLQWERPDGHLLQLEASARRTRIDIGKVTAGDPETPILLGVRIAYAKQF